MKGACPPHDALHSLKNINKVLSTVPNFNICNICIHKAGSCRLTAVLDTFFFFFFPPHILIKVGNKCLEPARNFDFLNCNQ